MEQESSRGASRVAFFGGSFDPPHLGHLAVARAARAALSLDTVLFAPVGAQPLKLNGSTARYEDRLAMTRLAIAGEPGFAISLADAPKPSGAPNFTLETLLALRAEIPPPGVLFCLMGADSFFDLRHWHRAAEIPFVAPLIVASRPVASGPIAPGSAATGDMQHYGQQISRLQAALPRGLTIEPETTAQATGAKAEVQSFLLHNPAGMSAPLYLLPGLDVEISASRIREQIRAASGNSVAQPELLPKGVLDFIRSHDLYR